MLKNVGKIDRILRSLLALFLIWLGVFYLNGMEGDLLGIAIALASLIPINMSATGSCPVFRGFNIHSLSKTELKKYGNPLKKKE